MEAILLSATLQDRNALDHQHWDAKVLIIPPDVNPRVHSYRGSAEMRRWPLHRGNQYRSPNILPSTTQENNYTSEGNVQLQFMERTVPAKQ